MIESCNTETDYKLPKKQKLIVYYIFFLEEGKKREYSLSNDYGLME